MAQTLLDQLNTMTVAVCDTGDLNSINKFKPRDATTNPSLITAAAQMPEYSDVVDGALKWAADQAGGDKAKTLGLALDRLAVEFGLRILKIVPGRVSTEVDARLSYDTKGSIEKGRYLIQQYEAGGIANAKDRVLIKIAATWEGIAAAERLERESIHCNLTLLFGFPQAVACADAGVSLVSPFVGRIYDWYKKRDGREFTAEEDPGVLSVRRIHTYYKRFGYQTEVMGASFRNLGQVLGLAGCDLLTISPELLQQLAQSQETVVRHLDAAAAQRAAVERERYDEPRFRFEMNEDPMATDKLAEGIRAFVADIRSLEQMVAAAA